VAWDTERTRQALLNAATAEFSEFGFSGARIERISLRAEVNRERLYSYFGNKQKLFEAVLARSLTASFENVAVIGSGASAVGDFAGRYFDAASTEPALARLIMWEALELGNAVDVSTRSVRAQDKVDALRSAHPSLSVERAQLLLLTTVSLINTWLQSRNLRDILVTNGGEDATWRAWLVNSITLLADDPAPSLDTL
jgi:AcrR family transcriptional regulator